MTAVHDVVAATRDIDIYSRPRALVLDSLIANQPERPDSDDEQYNDDDDYDAYDSDTGAQFWHDLLATAVDEDSYALSSREVNEDLRGLFGDIELGDSREVGDVEFGDSD